MKTQRVAAIACVGVSVLLTLTLVLTPNRSHDVERVARSPLSPESSPVKATRLASTSAPTTTDWETAAPTRVVRTTPSTDSTQAQSPTADTSLPCSKREWPLLTSTSDLPAVVSRTRSRWQTAALSGSLINQLGRHAARVCKRFQSQKKLWAEYLKPKYDAVTDPAMCLRRTPECAIFTRYHNTSHRAEMAQEAGESTVELTHEPCPVVDIDRFLLRKCCVEHAELSRALASLAAVASDVGVDVWLTAGSLLGAVREGGFVIPWDTDVDVLVSASDENALLKALQERSTPNGGYVDPAVAAASDVSQFYATVFRDVKPHAHGRMVAVVYGTPWYRHEEAARVELWGAVSSRKMQDPAVNLPVQPCLLNGVATKCPKDPLAVLDRGYGAHWCVACKDKHSNCKEHHSKVFHDAPPA